MVKEMEKQDITGQVQIEKTRNSKKELKELEL